MPEKDNGYLDYKIKLDEVNTIHFDIPGGGIHTIQPASPLPTITDPVNIDGTTQPDGRSSGPKIILIGPSVRKSAFIVGVLSFIIEVSGGCKFVIMGAKVSTVKFHIIVMFIFVWPVAE